MSSYEISHMDPTQQVAIITGCAGGIGAALTSELLKHGTIVYATDKDIRSLTGLPHVYECHMIELDVTNPAQIEACISRVMAEQGRLDLLINNAGIMVQGPAIEVPIEVSQQAFDINVLGQMRLVQAVAPYMIKQQHGTIVNIGSVLGFTGMPFLSTYSASKAALQSYTDALRVELSPFGVRVCYVAPGWVKTSLSQHAVEARRTFLVKDSPYWGYPKVRRFVLGDMYRDPTSPSAGATDPSAFAAQLVEQLLHAKQPRWFKHVLGGHMGYTYWLFCCYAPCWLTDLVYQVWFGLLRWGKLAAVPRKPVAG